MRSVSGAFRAPRSWRTAPSTRALKRATSSNAADADGEQEVAVLAGPGAVLHAAQLGAVRGAGEHRGEEAHQQGQGGAFEAPDGEQEAVQRRPAGSVVGRPSRSRAQPGGGSSPFWR